ncbi:subtilase family protein [Brevibacterium sanguinis]|uniref:Subtilase family protein n=2 Tax=Brevibacterium TaxID=1696 RepID=A0A366IGN6_9MICO|nr:MULTISPECIES: S8 family serine peptidase [Brevibacterium]RBP63658.1 subtilase family protein [Brevibacterium sanguinis]RBP70317.1 subtilase family protein [Brevibacterium celere]
MISVPVVRSARSSTHRAQAAARLACVSLLVLGLVMGPAQSVAAAPKAGPGQWFIKDYGIDKLWETSTGDGVKVAVIDSGVNADHENLKDVVGESKDFSGLGKDGTTPIGGQDTIHHGTAVAGVIAGQGGGAGPTGVAPDAEILSASMWLGPDRPKDSGSTRDQAAKALRWAVDSGAKVVNMSLGWDDPAWPQSWDEAFAYAYEKDVVVIACVGNASQGATQAWSPSTVPGVVGVGGLGKDGRVLGESTAPGTAVDLMGPAADIPIPYYSGGYAEGQGCSFASPVVSGVAALMRAENPDLSADEVTAKLLTTAKPVEGHKGRSTADKPDPIVGWGRLDPVAAIEADVPKSVPSAADALADWVKMHRRGSADASETGTAAPDEESSPKAVAPKDVVSSQSTPILGYSVLAVGGFAALVLLVAAGLSHRRRRR